jgi:hypothetical protein
MLLPAVLSLVSTLAVPITNPPKIQDIKVGPRTPVLAHVTAAFDCPSLEARFCSGNPAINCYGGLTTLTDEHSSILPGSLLGSSERELFFVSTKSCLNGGRTRNSGDTSGMVVLAGTVSNDVWSLDFASAYDSYFTPSQALIGEGQIFLSPMNHTSCPDVPATSQDPTFDLNYANPGSVVFDPTTGNLLMVYEGTNRCVGVSGTASQPGSFYSTLGIATSVDQGRSWPSYFANRVRMPHQNFQLGPDAPFGAMGPGEVCAGNQCAFSSIPAGYGRYPVLSTPIPLLSYIATGAALPLHAMGDSQPSAFVDDVPAGTPYLYTLQISSTVLTYPGTGQNSISIARAQLGGTGPLQFMKWYGEHVAFGNTLPASFALTNVPLRGELCGPGEPFSTTCLISNHGLGDGGGLESPIFPHDPANSADSQRRCQGVAQAQLGAQLSYVPQTSEYLLTFICTSPVDPSTLSGPPANAKYTRGAAWFFSTMDASVGLGNQMAWSPPKPISGTWAWLTTPPGKFCDYDGWYQTFMSPGDRPNPGYLNASGYVFSLSGCQNSAAQRTYLSRPFHLVIQ